MKNDSLLATPSERLKIVIADLGLNPNSFAISLKYKSSTGIQDIIKARKKTAAGNPIGISKDLCKRITTHYPQYNPEWLMFGVGDRYISDSTDILKYQNHISELEEEMIKLKERLTNSEDLCTRQRKDIKRLEKQLAQLTEKESKPFGH